MLESLKRDVVKVAKQAQNDGLCKHKSGNFSARDSETGYVVMTPTGVDREVLSQRDMIVMDLDANVIENESGLKPTSEALMHLEIYKVRKDICAAVHTHSMYATTFAVLNQAVPAVVYEIAQLNLHEGKIPVAAYGRPGTKALSASVAGAIAKGDCCLMQGHGAVAADETDIFGAYLKAAYMEELSELYFHALAVRGSEPDVFPPEELHSWTYPSEIKFPGDSK